MKEQETKKKKQLSSNKLPIRSRAFVSLVYMGIYCNWALLTGGIDYDGEREEY